MDTQESPVMFLACIGFIRVCRFCGWGICGLGILGKIGSGIEVRQRDVLDIDLGFVYWVDIGFKFGDGLVRLVVLLGDAGGYDLGMDDG